MQMRCEWANRSPALQKYHDEVWGKPLFSNQALFESLSIQILQSGLDFRTILNKMPALVEAFDQFSVVKVAKYDDKQVAQLLQNPAIIRNQRKIRRA
jgi:DNA-3-methyladenine glycosylase I